MIVHTISNVGWAESGVVAVALMIFIGGLLFGLRWMPGPYFTLGAAAMSPSLIVAHRRSIGRPILPRLRVLPVQPLVVLGLLAVLAGVAIDLHSAWSVDVSAVHRILQLVSVGT
jgi:hypothetical protein